MVSDEMVAVLRRLHSTGRTGLDGNAARECARVLGADGLALSLGGTPRPPELVWSTPGTARELEDAQFTLGEGPGYAAVRDRALVLEPDLSKVPESRWPAFLPAAAELGTAAVFAFPLQLGAVCLGTLTAHRRRAGPLGAQALRDAVALTDALTLIFAGWAGGGPEAAVSPGAATARGEDGVGEEEGDGVGAAGDGAAGDGRRDGRTNGGGDGRTAGESGDAAPPRRGPAADGPASDGASGDDAPGRGAAGDPGAGPERGPAEDGASGEDRRAAEPGEFEESGLHRAEVHQATGMISVQLGVPLAEALVRLRAYAYRTGRPITRVAEDVVARRVRFDADEREVRWENDSHDT